ncbi:MAG TPA: SprT family protein [Lactobacillaceae bacterium]|jgi:SprT-like protein
MTDHDLQQLVERVSQTAFGQPFLHVARFNRRLKTSGGRYLLASHDLEFNSKFDGDVLIGIIKHELVHYHLHLRGGGYRHGDADFKRLLAQVGGSRFAPNTPHLMWVYRCQNGHELFKARRFDTKRYVCGQCQAHLTLIDRREVG